MGYETQLVGSTHILTYLKDYGGLYIHPNSISLYEFGIFDSKYGIILA